MGLIWLGNLYENLIKSVDGWKDEESGWKEEQGWKEPLRQGM